MNKEKEQPVNIQSPPPLGPPPDGGWVAWSVVGGAFCCLFTSFGWINCIGIFQNYYSLHQLAHYSNSTIAWIPSLESFMMFFGGIFAGRIFDSYGPRWLLLFGSFFHVFGLMMVSISTKYYQIILAQGVCSPIGASAIFFVATASVSTWFKERRAFALGIVFSGSSLGGVIFPIMVNKLTVEVGFAWTMRICAFLILFLMVIANLTLKSRLHHQPKKINVHQFIQPLKEIPFLLVITSSFLFFLGVFLPFNYIVQMAVRNGMSASLANYLVSIISTLSILGRTIPGYLADRLGVFVVMISVSYLSAILCSALWIPSRSNASIIVFAALYGFSSGGFVSLGPAIVAQISNLEELGIRLGTYFAIISIAALISNPIGGALVPNPATDPFWKLQLFASVMMAAGSTGYVVVWIYLRRVKAKERVEEV
ncbi:hypothetical protein BCIN_03g02090 [Botrytis cinerea B05.10]|uniref:Major facilitator superfamily (MFS) profile domain-containing protein n=2 Tax=Botryotinia fuckeliana TaxID=40559 RepID=A0A384JBK0_BOTFB|nr:hypothetical protein BCIN_03g02090 [Botrytis cinerea B05.10]ATZ47933.1 hypothetical protein BCIN_03g02090 [Botrytis cinerea B05.10]